RVGAHEARREVAEELAGAGYFDDRCDDGGWAGEIGRQHAGASGQLPHDQEPDREDELLDGGALDHASCSARAFSTSSRSRSQISMRMALYSGDLRNSDERTMPTGMRMSALMRPGRAENTITRVPR